MCQIHSNSTTYMYLINKSFSVSSVQCFESENLFYFETLNDCTRTLGQELPPVRDMHEVLRLVPHTHWHMSIIFCLKDFGKLALGLNAGALIGSNMDPTLSFHDTNEFCINKHRHM